MTPLSAAAGRTLALFGLGGSGLATADALRAGGAEVLVWDDAPAARDRAAARGHRVVDLSSLDFAGVSSLVLSPGVPLTHPAPHWAAQRAQEAGVEIIGDIELFCRERRALAPGAPMIAITGTNGKSTTTALTAHMFRAAGWDVQLGGNIGTAILALAPPAQGRLHVIEVSSFQIDLAPSLDPSVGMLINITPDHIDRHGTLQAYAAVKERLVAGAEWAVVGVDDALSADIHDRLALRAAADPDRLRTGRVSAVSVTGPVENGVCLRDETLVQRVPGRPDRVLATTTGLPTLRGLHNIQNAAFAAAAGSLLALTPQDIQSGLRTFPGLAHRLESVGRRGRVLFVNDSKATNADSTEKALRAFPRVHWIVGGRAKEGGIEPLRPLFDRVAEAFLIGESSEDFAATLAGAVPFRRCGTLEAAVEAAATAAAGAAEAEPVVLLSPACASYDQFRNFEERGDRFRALAAALGAESPAAGVSP